MSDHDGTVPRAQLRQQRVNRGARALGNLRETLTVNSALDVLTGQERSLLLRELFSHVTSSHPLPLTGVDLTQPVVVPHRQVHPLGKYARGVSGAHEITADDHRWTVCRQRGSGDVRLLSTRVGQRSVELTLPDATGVVVCLTMTPDDKGSAALQSHHVRG